MGFLNEELAIKRSQAPPAENLLIKNGKVVVVSAICIKWYY